MIYKLIVDNTRFPLNGQFNYVAVSLEAKVSHNFEQDSWPKTCAIFCKNMVIFSDCDDEYLCDCNHRVEFSGVFPIFQDKTETGRPDNEQQREGIVTD